MKVKDIIIKANGRNISGRTYLPLADKFPVVIISHGFNGSCDDFKEYAEILVKNEIGVLTYDFCGGSLRSKSDWSTTDMTVFTEKEDLLAVIDFAEEEYNAENIFLFGASMGGLVSALVAENNVDRLQGMALLYPALCVADDWNKRFADVAEIPDVHNAWEVPLGKAFFETLHNFDVFEHIGNFTKDVLIIHGSEDKVVPVEYSLRADEIYTNSELKIFHGEGHGFSHENDEKVAKILADFIKKRT